MIEEAVVKIWDDDPTIGALAADRFYPEELPQKPKYPAGVYQVITGDSRMSMDGPSGLALTRFQFSLYAETVDKRVALKKAVMARFNGYKGTFKLDDGLIEIQLCWRVDEDSGHESDLEGAAETVYRLTLDFNFWHTETY